MFDYLKFTKLISTMCDEKRIKLATRARLPAEVLGYLLDNGVKVEGAINFHEDENCHILIIYGKTEYALLTDIIDNRYTFCIFADTILSNDNKFMKILDMTFDSVMTIMSYMYPNPQYTPKPYIKDTHKEFFEAKIKDICVCSIWAVFGDSFIEEYKTVFPEDTEITKVIKVFEDSI